VGRFAAQGVPLMSTRHLVSFAMTSALSMALASGALAAKGKGNGGVVPGPRPALGPLRTVPVPPGAGLRDIITDRNAAILLGKALFWDQQVGSDGRTACATCHFQAGSDTRSLNTLNPGANATFDVHAANSQLAAADFPFHKLSDPANRATVVSDRDDIGGSQGVMKTSFNAVVPGSAVDDGTAIADAVFTDGLGNNVRQVTGRNAPSVVNAIFNQDSFC